MKTSSLGLLAILLQAYVAYGRKVTVDAVGKDGEEPYFQGSSVYWGTGRHRQSFHCEEDETPFVTPDKLSATCCQEDESLKGSKQTEWHCCAVGHDVTGSAAVGYECCVEGSTFDGKLCKRPVTCPNGQVMVDEKCQCPEGKIMAADGTCEAAKPNPKPDNDDKCDSGLETGSLSKYTPLTRIEVAYFTQANATSSPDYRADI